MKRHAWKLMAAAGAAGAMVGCGTVYQPVNEHQVIVDGGFWDEPNKDVGAAKACDRIFEDVLRWEPAPGNPRTYALVTCQPR